MKTDTSDISKEFKQCINKTALDKMNLKQLQALLKMLKDVK